MRQFIDIVAENATEMPEMVYHGTNLRAWNEVAGHDEPLYLTSSQEEAQSHAERSYVSNHDHEDPEYKDHEIAPIIVSFRLEDLVRAGLSFEPDWGWDMAEGNTTWQESLRAVGSFSVPDFSQGHKSLGTVAAAFPDTFPI